MFKRKDFSQIYELNGEIRNWKQNLVYVQKLVKLCCFMWSVNRAQTVTQHKLTFFVKTSKN